jgi:hypothetical protein
VANQSVSEDTVMGPLPFTVRDVDTSASALTVTAELEQHRAGAPERSLALGGSGGNRTITAKPAANGTGTSTITLTVNDGQRSTTRSFTLTATAANDSPTIGAISNRNIAEDGVMGPVSFTVSDVDDDPATLTVTTRSSNATLVPQTGLVLGGRLSPDGDRHTCRQCQWKYDDYAYGQ